MRKLLVPCVLAPGLLAVSACSDARATPRDAFDAVRAAVAAGDSRALFDGHDAETRAYRRHRVRDWRALLARGDPPEEVLAGTGVSADDVLRGTVDEAAVRILAERSAMAVDAAWFSAAAVVAEQQESDATARLGLRGADGQERTLWFVRESDGWKLDYYRTSVRR